MFENSVNEFIEVTFYVNIAILFAFCSFFLEAREHQPIIAYISGIAAIVQFLFAISYLVYVIILSKTSLCVKLKVFNCKQNDELVNYPPTNIDAVNPLRPVAMPSLDHHRENYRGMKIACSDSNGAKEERGTVNTYGSYSQTMTRVISFKDEVTEKSPLIPASLKI